MREKGYGSIGYLLREGLNNAWVNRLMSIASVGVLVCCIFLMGVASLISININAVMSWVEDQNVIMVFIYSETDAVRVTEIGFELENIGNVRSVEFVPKSEGLDKILGTQDENIQDIIELEMQDENNPLPDAYRVTVNNLQEYDITRRHIESIEGVEKIRDKRDFIMRLNNINKVVRIAGLSIVGILFIVSLFIITNTIKLTMHMRKLEISIMKSVGATNGFVRIPFMIEGMALGLIAGLISFLLIWAVYGAGIDMMANVISTMGLISFKQIAGWVFTTFALSGMLIGSLGSGISITKYLKREGGIYND